MNVMLDTNIFLDLLIKERLNSFPESKKAVADILSGGENVCVVSASAITDIYYVLRKALHSSEKAKECIKALHRFSYISDVKEDDIQNALDTELDDFEDGVVDEVAYRLNCDLILTRNANDFVGSKVTAVTPHEYLKHN